MTSAPPSFDRRAISLGLAAGSLSLLSAGAAKAGEVLYSPAPQNPAAREWFQDAKFGIFIHWGLYCELGGAGDAGIAEWVMEHKRIPASKYKKLAAFFNPVGFDADEWVRGFKAAGARYITFTSKHHDGFAMYDSKVNPYNVVNATPFRRDPIAELAVACRKHGLKLFLYYSQLDWHHPDYVPGRTGGGWTGVAYSGDWNRYIDFQNAMLRELLTNYGPIGGIWFDGWWDQKETPLRDKWRLDETYALIHSLQPDALITNNHHMPPFPGEDYQTFERDLPGQNKSGFSGTARVSDLPREMAETMNGSWGYNFMDDQFKSPQTLIETLVGAAGRNANLLLNTGPMPNGRIQPENLDTLAAIGRWLKTYGESVHGTRGGPTAPHPWGVTTQTSDHIYVHVLDWQDEMLPVPVTVPVRSATALRDGARVAFVKTRDGVQLRLPPKAEAEWDRIIRLDI